MLDGSCFRRVSNSLVAVSPASYLKSALFGDYLFDLLSELLLGELARAEISVDLEEPLLWGCLLPTVTG
jgi:hypothetical protein